MTTSNPLKKWLKTQLEALVSVQRCTFNQAAMQDYEPDVVVYLWTGARVHIYILTQTPKTRFIKAVLQNDSQLGIGSLFIVSADIVPFKSSKQTFKPDEWLLAVHALTNDRVYLYTPDSLLQAHFEKIGLTDNYRVMFGAPVEIQQLRYARVTIKLQAVKGFWMLADFGTDAFWKKQAQDGSYYEIPAYKREQHPPPRNAHHGRASTNGNSQRQTQQPVSSKLEESYQLLGLPAGATRDEVKSAFRKLAFQVHPDVSQLEKNEAEARFKALSEAYEFIKSANEW